VDLGPTYVKMGQIISTRKDIFSSRITTPLEDLQDKIDPIDFLYMDDVFQSEFGMSCHAYFKHFDETPIACASMSQVYVATLQNNRNVAVKIQKPNLDSEILDDTRAIDNLLKVMTRIFPTKVIKDLTLVADTMSSSLAQELDFENEANNMRTFRKISKGSVVIPRVFVSQQKKTVLIMEYVTGRKISDVTEVEIGNRLMLMFLKQVLEEGYLHADLHAGNIALTDTDKVVLYDFGLVSYYNAQKRDAFKRILRGFMFHNTNDIIDCMLENKFIHVYDSNATKHLELPPSTYLTLHALVQYAYTYTEETNLTDIGERIRRDPYIAIEDLPFYVDADLILMFKTVCSLEGVCKSLNPEFSYTYLYSRLIQNMFDIDFIADKIMSDIRSVTDQNDAINDAYVMEMKAKSMLERSNSVEIKNKSLVVLLGGTMLTMVLTAF
jgi:ubiquinone biosynthesis protein